MATPHRKKVTVLRQEVQLGFDFDALPEPTDPVPGARNVFAFPTKSLAPLPKKVKRGRGRPAEQAGNDYEWTLADMNIIRVGLVHDALEELANGYSSKSKAHLEWIKSDAIEPFSFLVCCKTCNYDPDELRDALLSCLDEDEVPWFHSSHS